MQSLDFNKTSKSYLTITLTNGKSYMLTTPTKRLLDRILSMNDLLKVENGSDTSEIEPSTIDDLYKISADIMSTNKTRTNVSSDELEEMWDLEDLILFFSTYMKYLESITNSKN